MAGQSTLISCVLILKRKKACWNKSPPKPKPSGEKILAHFVLTNNKNSYRIEKKSCEFELPPFPSWNRNIQHQIPFKMEHEMKPNKKIGHIWSYIGIKFYQLQGVCVENKTSPKETSALRQIWTKTTRMTPAEISVVDKKIGSVEIEKSSRKLGWSANGYIYLLIYPQQISNFVYLPTNLP